MPTILRRDGFRFYFFSNEGDEPRHVHVDRAGATAKVWLRPVAVARNIGFNQRDLATIVDLVREYRDVLEEDWNEHFGGTR